MWWRDSRSLQVKCYYFFGGGGGEVGRFCPGRVLVPVFCWFATGGEPFIDLSSRGFAGGGVGFLLPIYHLLK